MKKRHNIGPFENAAYSDKGERVGGISHPPRGFIGEIGQHLRLVFKDIPEVM